MRYLLAVLGAAAILVGQYFYAGAMRPVFALPSYFLAGLAALGLGTVFFLRGKSSPPLSCLGAVAAFGLWLIWRELAYPEAWVGQTYLRLTLGCLAIYFLLAYGVTSPGSRLWFVGLLIGGGLVQAVIAGGQFAQLWSVMPQGWFSEQLRLWYDQRLIQSARAHGSYLNGNHLAWFLNSAGLFALALGCFGRGRAWVKILLVYGSLVILAGSILCISRGGIIGLAAGGATFLFLGAVAFGVAGSGRRSAMFVLLVAAILLPTAILLFITDQNVAISGRLQTLVEDSYRPRIFYAVSRQFQVEPLLGTGPGTFAYYSRSFRYWPSPVDDYYAHNDWAQLAADFGLPAAALLLLAFLLHLHSGWRGYLWALRQRMALSSLPQSNTAALLIGGLSSAVCFAVHSLFDFNLQLPANALLAAACAGLIANPGLDRDSRLQLSWPRPLGLALGVILGAALLIATWAARSEYHWLIAENNYLTGRLPSAIEEAETGLAISPSHPRLHRLLGQAYLAQAAGKPHAERASLLNQALRELQTARDAEPLEKTHYLVLSETALKAGQLTEGTAAAMEAIRLDPLQARGYELYGLSMELRNDLPRAVQIYDLAQRLPGAQIAPQRRQNVLQRLMDEERKNSP